MIILTGYSEEDLKEAHLAPRRRTGPVSLASAAHQAAPTPGDCMAEEHSQECVPTERATRPWRWQI